MKRFLKTAAAFFLSAAMLVPQFTAPVFADPPADDTENTEPVLAAPLFQIYVSEPQEIKAGFAGYFKIKIKNISQTKVSKVLAEITPPDEIVLLDDSGSQEISSTPNNHYLTVQYDAPKKITTDNLKFTVNLKYYYYEGKNETIGSTSATLSVPAVATTESVPTDPVIKVIGQSFENPIEKNSSYDYTITFRNVGDVDITDVYVNLEGSESIYFTGGTEYGHFDRIPSGQTGSLKVKLNTTDNIANIKQQVTANLSYSYKINGEKKNGEASGTTTIIAKVTEENKDPSAESGSAPNIIIKGYDIGAEQIAAGDSFSLNLDMFNTNSAIKIENLIMTVSAGESININGGTNTFFYPSMAAGGTISETIPLKALPTAATGITSIGISFKFDYVKDGVSTPGSSEQLYVFPLLW